MASACLLVTYIRLRSDARLIFSLPWPCAHIPFWVSCSVLFCSAGHWDALPEAGRDMLVMYPADAQKRNLMGSAALLAHEGP